MRVPHIARSNRFLAPKKTSATWRKRGFSKAMESMESMGSEKNLPEIFGMSPHLVTLSFFEPFENTFQEPLLWSQGSMESHGLSNTEIHPPERKFLCSCAA
jgi:hypothetical protein